MYYVTYRSCAGIHCEVIAMLYLIHAVQLLDGRLVNNHITSGGPYTLEAAERYLSRANVFYNLELSSVYYYASPILDL